MSSNCITFGWMGALKEPISEESRDFVSERLDEKGLGLNYEGTLVYRVVEHDSLEEAFGIHVLDNAGRNELFNDVWSMGFALDIESIRMFVDLWYNGVDSGHSDITLEQFREKSK